jgi:hypothetical protein
VRDGRTGAPKLASLVANSASGWSWQFLGEPNELVGQVLAEDVAQRRAEPIPRAASEKRFLP